MMVPSRIISRKQKHHVRDASGGDVCVLKPDESQTQHKLHLSPPHQEPIAGPTVLPHGSKQLGLHAYVCVLTDKVLAILCWGSSQTTIGIDKRTAASPRRLIKAMRSHLADLGAKRAQDAGGFTGSRRIYSSSVTSGSYEHGRASHAYTLYNVIVVAMVMYRGYLALENSDEGYRKLQYMQVFKEKINKSSSAD